MIVDRRRQTVAQPADGMRGRIRRALRGRARSAAGGCGGWTLIELLVVMSMFIVVLGATLNILLDSTRVQTRDSAWAYSIQDARTGLAEMTHEIRQASIVNSDGPNLLDFNLTLAGTAEHVVYECDVVQTGTSYRECVRFEAAPGAALPSSGTVAAQYLVNGTLADPVFSYTPDADPINPTFVDVTLKVPASGGTLTGGAGLNHTVVLSDGAYMRDVGGPQGLG